MTPALLFAAGTLIVAALAVGLPILIARSSLRFQLQLQREAMTAQLHERDVQIAELQGQMQGLKDVIESFARAFVDRRTHT